MVFFTKSKILLLCSFVSLYIIGFGDAEEEKNIVSARIESCPGCKLNRLPQVRAFIYEDIPKYENVEFKKIHGASPEVIFLNEADEEVERINLEQLNREQCNDLLKSKGFVLKENKEKEL